MKETDIQSSWYIYIYHSGDNNINVVCVHVG
jgi:hypothetical protein